jgi:hypothetical protein
MKKYLNYSLYLVLFSISSVILSTSANASSDVATPVVSQATIDSPVQQPLTSNRASTATLQFQSTGNAGISSLAVVTFLCEATTQNIYQRGSYNNYAIGTKPSVTCPFPVDSISITTTVTKKVFFGWSTQDVFTSSNSGQRTLAPTDIAVQCTNTKETLWDASSVATAVYQGKTYQTTVYPGNAPAYFPCGT